MSKLRAAAGWVMENFGPILVYYAANHFFGLGPAVSATALWSIAYTAWAYKSGREMTGIFKFSAALGVCFGLVDLCLRKSVFFRYEAAATNLATAAFFASSLRRPKCLIEELAEPRMAGREVTAGHKVFFRALTWLWSAFFAVRAAAFAWIARRFSLGRNLALRTAIEPLSLGAMIAFSIFGSRPLFSALRRLGMIQQIPQLPQAT